MKLLEHRINIIEKVLKKRIRVLVEVDDMQFGFMPGRGTTDALFIVRRMQEEYREKDKKLYMYFVNLEKAFDRVPRRVMQWALMKKGLLKILVKIVMSLYEGSMTKVKVGSEFSEEFYVAIGVHWGFVFLSWLFAIVVDVVTENTKEGLIKEAFYVDDLVLMSEMMEGLKKRFLKWRSALESKGLKMNLEKTKVMVCGSEDEVIQSRIGPCGICGKGMTVNLVLCTKCDNGFMEGVLS